MELKSNFLYMGGLIVNINLQKNQWKIDEKYFWGKANEWAFFVIVINSLFSFTKIFQTAMVIEAY